MRRRRFGAALLLGLVTACSSTTQPANRSDAPASPVAQAEPTNRTAGSSIAPSASAASVGPVTSSMATLQIGGERYSTLGDPNAPITMLEYSDFGCPFCRSFAAWTLPQIKANYIDTGKVYFVYKNFPILTTHPQADYAAQAAECAGDQGKYWDMHDQLFARPGEWDTTTAEAQAAFTRYAATIGLDAATFGQCMRAGRYADEVGRDFREARALGLTGTPAFIINGKLLSGARPFEQFQQVLDRELGNR